MCAEPARAQMEIGAATGVDAEAAMRAMSVHPASTTQPRLRPLVVEAIAGPFSLARALTLAARHDDLRVPAKLVLSANGAHLLAEVIRAGDPAREAERARRALVHGCAWIAGEQGGAAACDPARGGVKAATVAEALETLKWPAIADGAGRYRVHGLGGTAMPRIRIELTERAGETAVRVVAVPVVMRVAHAASARAIAIFALRANARLRLARLGAAAPSAAVACVARDVMFIADDDAAQLAQALMVARDALSAAASECAGALRALKSPAVATAFLAMQCGEAALAQPADPLVGRQWRT